MAEADDKNPGADQRRAREERLAKALRENLRRRKAGAAPIDLPADQSKRR